MKNMIGGMLILFIFLGCEEDFLTIREVYPDQPNPEHVHEVISESLITVVNYTDAKKVLERIQQGIEPQASSFKALIADANDALKFEPNPPKHLTIMGGYEPNSNLGEMRKLLGSESVAAYTTALAWLYSGNNIYAVKASEILRKWAETGTTFNGNDAGLQLGSFFNGILYAADILKEFSGWTLEDRELFRKWWYREVVIWYDHVVYVRKMTNNWLDAVVLGMLTTAVVFDDQDLQEEALEILDGYFKPRNDNPNWKFANDENGVYLPKEVTRNDGRSGITYTAYALTTMTQAFEIASRCGYNWWYREAQNGATIKEVIEYYFRWAELGEEFPWHEDPNVQTSRKNPYELANNYFPGEIGGLKEWLNASRPVNGYQGDPYITLNRGDMPQISP